MSQIDTVRPIIARKAGAGTAVPSGTLSSVTADDSDATYIQFPLTSSGSNWSLRMGPHLPAAGYQRHQLRGRIRIRTDTGTATETIDIGNGTTDVIVNGQVPATTTITEQATGWSSAPGFNLSYGTPLDQLNVGGGRPSLADGGMTELRTAEVYLDIDCRLRPQYTPKVLDSAGVDRTGGIVTDTDRPVVSFGTVGYDGLPASEWSFEMEGPAGISFAGAGFGQPPATATPGGALPNGAYAVRFSVTSTIRGADPFTHAQTITFTLNNTVPPPSPPNVTVVREGDGYRVSWEYAGGQMWDGDYVVAEVWRDDCTGSQRIATVPDGLTGSYLDLAIPQIDTEHVLVGQECTLLSHGCDVTYRVRYIGYVSNTVTIPATIPVDLVLGWPGTAASIPSGWLRVTSLDGIYPRGATGTGVPTATGGAASHSHTTPSHTHGLPAHEHQFPGKTDTSNVSINSERKDKAEVTVVNQSHSHSLPLLTGSSNTVNSGSAAPGTDTNPNQPVTENVIWIRSDGSATSYPVGVLGFSAETPSGWVKDANADGKFLRGADPGGNGGALYGIATHSHTVLSHTHTSTAHDHPNFTTGLSGPAASTEGIMGGIATYWLGRHTHPGNVIAGPSGAIPAVTGGTTSTSTLEPPHRRLRVLRNTGGGAQTRIIGLYTDAVADLDPVLTLCNGSNGTPDMRGQFCRDIGTGSVGSTGGASTHNHTTPAHNHGFTSPHSHALSIGPSNSRVYGREAGGTQSAVPTEGHTHTSDETLQELMQTGNGGVGTTSTVSHLPPYREVHFVRVEGTVAGGSLPVPELKSSDFASFTVPALLHTDGLDRIGSLTAVMPVATVRESTYPRVSTDSVPKEGGKHTVSTTTPGVDLSLTIAVKGRADIDMLEEILSDRVYWAPLGGDPGWYEPGSWSVAGPVTDVKVLSLTLARSSWPSTPDPEEYL